MTPIEYTVYDPATGLVLFGGRCEDPDILRTPDVAVVTGAAYTSGWFLGGVHMPMPAAPTEYHQFNYTSKQWEDPRTTATEWAQVRFKRGELLSDTDWVVTKAVELGTPVPADWKAYRHALRDITTQTDPFAVVWPTRPTA